MVGEIEQLNQNTIALSHEARTSRREIDAYNFVTDQERIAASAVDPETYLGQASTEDTRELFDGSPVLQPGVGAAVHLNKHPLLGHALAAEPVLLRPAAAREVYLKAYANGLEAHRGLREYFRFYNERRPHQVLGYRTPAEVFYGQPVEEDLKERRCSDQPALVLYGGTQESHLIEAESCPTDGVHLIEMGNTGWQAAFVSGF